MIVLTVSVIFVFLIIKHFFYWNGMDLDYIYRKPPIFFGHRGDRYNFPENTISSFQSAVKNGLSAIEVDVMLTKDAKLVCSHNFDLACETNGKGLINEIDYQEIAKIKTGMQFPISKQETIPLFTDVVAALPNTILINIEIKTQNTFDLKTAKKVAQLIRSGQIPQNVIVSSFNPLAVRLVKIISRSIPTGYIYRKEKNFTGVFIARPDCLHPEAELITDQLLKFCNRRNIRINTWTVNKAQARDWLISKNIEGIITDYPALANK